MNQKLKFLCFRGIHNSLSPFRAKSGYSRIKIDHIADSLLKDAVLTVGVNLRLCLSSLMRFFDKSNMNYLNNQLVEAWP